MTPPLSGERCRSVDGLWSSTRNRSLTHWEAQTAHRLHSEHLFTRVCELQTNSDGRCLILGRGCAPGVVLQENSWLLFLIINNGLVFCGLRVALRSHPGHTCSVWAAPRTRRPRPPTDPLHRVFIS